MLLFLRFVPYLLTSHSTFLSQQDFLYPNTCLTFSIQCHESIPGFVFFSFSPSFYILVIVPYNLMPVLGDVLLLSICEYLV